MSMYYICRRFERQLKIFALWVFFYRFEVGTTLLGTFGLFNGSPDVCHGPQVDEWPWWKLFIVNACKQDRLNPQVWGRNIWIYTRRSGEVRGFRGEKYKNVGRLIHFSIDMRSRTKDLEMWL